MTKIINIIEVIQKPLSIIIIVLFFHTAVNFYILNKSEIVREGDDGSNIAEGLGFHQKLVNKEYKSAGRDCLGLLNHPKVFPLTEGLALTLLEKAGLRDINSMTLFSNAFFLFILLLSVYKIGSILYDKKTGLLAAILLSFSPIIFGQSRISMLDFPLTGMICLCFLSLLKTKNFTSLFFSLVTAVLFILAQLTKETAIIFILPLFLYYFIVSLRINEQRKQKVINFSLILFIFLILIGAIHLNPINERVFKRYWGASFLTYSNKELFCYTGHTLGYFYLGMIFSIVAFPLILRYIANIRKRNVFLTLCLFCPLLIFSFSTNRVPRFLIPVLPALFLLLASEVFSLKHLKIRKIYISILILAMVFQYAKFNFFSKIPIPYRIHEGGLLNIYKDKDFYAIKKLLDFFEEVKIGNPKQNKPFLIIFTSQEFIFVLNYELKLRNLPFSTDCPSSADVPDAQFPGMINWKEYLLTADYVVDKTGEIPHRGAFEDITGEFKKSLEDNADFFKVAYSFKDSKGDSVIVYKNVKKFRYL